MAAVLSREGLRFLYRSDEGAIGRRLWWLGLVPLVSFLAVMTLVWLSLLPYAGRGLDERAFLDPLTAAAYVFLTLYAFSILLAGVCFVMLSMKRLRDRARPVGLAGLVPLAGLLAGAAHWLEPQMGGAFPLWAVYACDGFLALAGVWTIIEMGVLGGARDERA
jgi:uncharacterized membrane protein YhaH (DUF805 family)